MTDLSSLIARVEQASGPDRKLDALIAKELGFTEQSGTNGATGRFVHNWTDPRGTFVADIPAYTASIDAAMSLVDWTWMKRWDYYFALEQDWEDGEKWIARADQRGDECGHVDMIISAPCANKALAVTSLALRARKAP